MVLTMTQVLPLVITLMAGVLLGIGVTMSIDEYSLYKTGSQLLPWSTIIFNVGAVVAGALAIWKTRLFRETEPYLEVTQNVTHRSISDKLIHVHVIATIHNPSKVKIEPKSGDCTLQGIQWMEDSTAEEHSQYEEIMENISASKDWNGTGYLEPGESHRTFFDFIIPNYYTVIRSYVSIANPRSKRGHGSAWNNVAIIDIANATEVKG